MKLLVTGAAGFLGRHIVDEALREGHWVRALDLPSTAGPDDRRGQSDNLEWIRADLNGDTGLNEAVRGVDCVIHAAAKMTGGEDEQRRGTVEATRNLLGAMEATGVRHIVQVGTFSVYGYLDIPVGATVTEESPRERHLQERDAYARTKTEQEDLVIAHAERLVWTWTVMRVGVLYGKDRLFSSRCGVRLGRRTWLVVSTPAEIPLTYVENCAQCLVLAATTPGAAGQVINVLDSEPPRQREFMRLLRERVHPRPRVIAVPWTVARCVAALADCSNKYLLGGRAKLPGLLVPARLHAQFRPLRYSNQKAHELLGWTPRYTLTEGLDRCVE